jgi:hypothetical protein
MASSFATARRSLAWRIEQFLREHESMPMPTLTGGQSDRVVEAIERLAQVVG